MTKSTFYNRMGNHFLPTSLIRTLVLFVCTLSPLYGATIIATSSGSWNSASTWNGSVPPTVLQIDQVVIPVGITVDLDNSVRIDGLSASIRVDGTLRTSSVDSIDVFRGELSGNGRVDVGIIRLNTLAIFSFRGQLDAEYVRSSALSIQWSAQTQVRKEIELRGLLTLLSGSSIDLMAGAEIILDGGGLMLSGGLLDLQKSYTVRYVQSPIVCGVELSGSGLRNVVVDISSGSSLSLSSDLILDGSLVIRSGTLQLNNHSLFISGNVEVNAGAALASTAFSSISISSSMTQTSVLRFSSSGSIIDKLQLSLSPASTVVLQSQLEITGSLRLQGGSFDFSNQRLHLDGDFISSGSLKSSATSELSISSSANLGSALRFANGSQNVGVLRVSMDKSLTLRLQSPLRIHSQLVLENKSNLSIEGQTVELVGTLNGDGALVVDSLTELHFTSSSALSSSLSVLGSSLGTLRIDASSSFRLNMQSNLRVLRTLNIARGNLSLGSHRLETLGGINCSVDGSVAASSGSVIVVNTQTTAQSVLRFGFGVQTVDSLLVRTDQSSSLEISGDVSIATSARFNTPRVLLSGARMKISGQLDLAPVCRIHSSKHSSLLLNTSARLLGSPQFNTEANELDSLVLPGNSRDTIQLRGAINIQEFLQLHRGVIRLDSTHLTLSGNIFLGAETQIATSAQSSIELRTTSLLGATLRFVSDFNEIGELHMSIPTSTRLSLQGVAHVQSELNLQSGNLTLDDVVLGINGSFHQSLDALISSDSTSSIRIGATARNLQALRFSSTAHALLDFDVLCQDPSKVEIASDLDIHHRLELSKAQLYIAHHELRLKQGASIVNPTIHGYISMAPNGRLSMIKAGTSAATLYFPIGTQSSFLAMQLDLLDGSSPNTFQASVVEGVRTNGLSGTLLSDEQAHVKATWDLQASTSIDNSASIRVQWPTSIETSSFSRNSAFVAHYDGSQWDKQSGQSARSVGDASYSLERSSVSELGAFSVFGSSSTSIGSEAVQVGAECSPNPADTYIRLPESMLTEESADIAIYSVSGELVQQCLCNSAHPTIELVNIPNGLYFLRFIGSQTQSTHRLLVIHR